MVSVSAENDFPPCIEKSFTIGSSEHESAPDDSLELSFALLGCETKDPYGPLTHTAQLLIDMLGMAAIKANECIVDEASTESKTKCYSRQIRIRMSIYNAQLMEYPRKDRWDVYDGIIIPGSFSSAYDTDPWIEQLKQIIQSEIVPNHLKTLGICFGHQVLAHSFSMHSSKTPNSTTECDGRAVATPTGPRAGRFQMPLTSAGCSLLHLSKPIPPNTNNQDGDTNNNREQLQLYFTHGDMVEQIPNVAVNLGGDSTVPIQSAAYFATSQDAEKFKYRKHAFAVTNTESLQPIPYAITMQAHPEYSTSKEMGIYRTLFQCMDAMEQRRHQRPNTEI